MLYYIYFTMYKGNGSSEKIYGWSVTGQLAVNAVIVLGQRVLEWCFFCVCPVTSHARFVSLWPQGSSEQQMPRQPGVLPIAPVQPSKSTNQIRSIARQYATQPSPPLATNTVSPYPRYITSSCQKRLVTCTRHAAQSCKDVLLAFIHLGCNTLFF